MYSRRQLIKSGACAGALSMLRPFSGLVGHAQAASPSDYKAIVCLFLGGGNDSNNVLIPTDPTGYRTYASGRGVLAIPQAQILQLAGVPYGVHPSMPGTQSLFGAGQLAFVANVGNLVAPLTMLQYLAGSAAIPQNLMSHSDQVSITQTAAPTSNISIGWGGAIADAIGPMAGTPSLPIALSYYGSVKFINGVDSPGLVSPGSLSSLPCAEGGACSALQSAINSMLACPESVQRVQADQALLARNVALDIAYASAVKQAQPFKTQQPAGAIYAAYTQIAQLMQVRNIVGAQRQIFYTSIGAFDTHANQTAYHGNLLSTMDGCITYFAQLLEELQLLDNVTLFTVSDFNRTLQANSGGGSDHAWGGHQIIMGGAVNGGKIYGTFPNLALGGPDDYSNQGRWLPTTSISQMGATLASWFGVPDSSLSSVFPGIGNFPNPKLAFL